MKTTINDTLLLGLALALGAATASAVPYASSVAKSGNTVSYVLNQKAASVEVILDGGAPVSMGTDPGTYSFDMTGKTTYQIKVTGNDAPAWTQYVPDQVSTAFYIPYGVSINKDPASPNFGKIYISEAGGGTTGGRTTLDGIYVLYADGTEATWSNGGQAWTGNSTPIKSCLGPDGRLYVADLANDLVWEFSDDLSVASPIIDASNRTPNQFVHGVYVEGSQATQDRKLYVMNGNYNDTARRGLIMYDLGGNATATPGDTGTQVVGPSYFNYYGYDVARDSNGDWYTHSYRANANQASPLVKLLGTGTWPLGDEPAEILWQAPKTNLYSFCIDISEVNGLAAYGHANGGGVFLYDINTGVFKGKVAGNGTIRELAFDVAGNLVTVDNVAERARFWSPGGYTVATTSFNGAESSFDLTRPAAQVSVVAAQATVSEAGPAVNFTISRDTATPFALTVHYTLSGTATNGVDYTSLSGSAVIPANAASVNVSVAPIDDSIAEASETVILNLTASPDYSVVVPANASITILDNEPTEIAFTTAAAKKLLESYAPSRVTHQVVRRGSLAGALTVNIAYSGTAALNSDFSGPATVSLADGAATVNLVLSPINDQAFEGDETVTASIAAGTGYTPAATGASISATVVDDDPPPGTVLFADAFDTDSAALWVVNMADPYPTSFAEFAWDYSALAGIPPAPGTTDGTTTGLRLRTGNVFSQNDAVSLSPLNQSFTGDYRLKFDMWINYNGPMGVGGPGSTQNFDAGVGTAGNMPIWQGNPGSDGVWFSVAGDGQSENDHGGDYYALIGGTWLTDESGVYAAGTGETPDSGMRASSHSYYSLWGRQTAPAEQLALYSGQTGTVAAGTAGMAWHTVVITKTGDVVTWVIDGITIATVTNTVMPFGENVFIGYQDVWAGGSLSDQPEMSFGLVDNLKVMTLAAPAAPVVTGISLVNGGTQVKITFTAGASDVPGAFDLVGASSLTGTFSDVPANITNPGSGQFEAVVPLGSGSQFFRVRRN